MFRGAPRRRITRVPNARSERGAALVEFALVLPVLMILLLGILDFGKAINYWIDQTHLANMGARWAAVGTWPGSVSCSSSTCLHQYIRAQGETGELRDGRPASANGSIRTQPGFQVCVAYPEGAIVGRPVEVTVRTTYHWLGYIAGKLSIASTPINGKATMRLEQQPDLTKMAATCG